MYSEIINLEKSITSIENAIDKVESIIQLNISFESFYDEYSKLSSENRALKLLYWENKDNNILESIKKNNNKIKLIEICVSDKLKIYQHIFDLIGKFKNRTYTLFNPLHNNGYIYKLNYDVNTKLKSKLDDLNQFKDYYVKKVRNYKILHINEILEIYNESGEL